MIVIQSERNDASANEVLEWIKYLDPTREVDHLSGNLEIVGISIKLSQGTEIEFSLKTKSGKQSKTLMPFGIKAVDLYIKAICLLIQFMRAL